ncbi:MAG: 2-C-methyl-D-erythritol 2,4-cyclodiphosphate synthase [Chloroflexota bacterium]|nr:2-C-methyl-D-erythritol 2,4-cyclodiphosphate synthase [Chloroflexota bacterium]
MTPWRAGTGYDIHRLVPGRRLILGGVDIPSEMGLAGHSDADALAHAVTDALLGACALGDIGHHFPPSDPAWRDADSIGLLAEAARRARKAGWQAHNVDATVVCERPHLAPFLPAMRSALAGALGIPAASVSVKAKTNEGLDAVGRGEAIAAQAIILIVAQSVESGLSLHAACTGEVTRRG